MTSQPSPLGPLFDSPRPFTTRIPPIPRQYRKGEILKLAEARRVVDVWARNNPYADRWELCEGAVSLSWREIVVGVRLWEICPTPGEGARLRETVVSVWVNDDNGLDLIIMEPTPGF